MLQNITFLHSKFFVPVLLFLLVLCGGILRFYDINWGAPFYFHPDERNIASSISQITLSDFNPRFFAYGSLPIYIIFFKGFFLQLLTPCRTDISTCQVTFEQAIVIGRLISALLSTLLIPMSYLIGNKLGNKRTGIVASCLVTFSTGLIQYAHFATFEMWSTFFSTVLFFFTLLFLNQPKKLPFYLMILTSGILVSVKISNLVLLLVPVLCLFVTFYKEKKHFSLLHSIRNLFFRVLIFGTLVTSIYLLTNPFVFYAQKEFLSSMDYESKVALGTLEVFYTGEFVNTVPIVFQLDKVFPFLLNPAVFVAGIVAVVSAVFQSIKQKSIPLFFLLIMFSLLFFSQILFYVKWVRYMVPTLPFLYLMIALLFAGVSVSSKNKRIHRLLSNTCAAILIFISMVFSVSYVITVYVEKDTRIAAYEFAASRISPNTNILSEVYDMGIVPFNETFREITLFNFYDLDSQEFTRDELDVTLKDTEYLILPSQRLLATRTTQTDKFPIGAAFYHSVLADRTRYTKVYETPCSVFCQITYLGDPVKRFEGTANVFDRPHVMIFKVHE